MRRWLKNVAVDLTPLKRRDVRLLFGGQYVSAAGSMITMVAIPYQLYELTRSPALVGLLGIAQFVPMLVIALASGAMADAVDRRKLVLSADAIGAVVIGLLALNASAEDPHVWLLFLCQTLASAAYALLRPPLDAMLPRLVPREEMKAAIALNWMGYNVAHIAGPALGGVLIASAGLPATYLVDAVTFGVSMTCVALMRATPPPEDADRPGLRSILDGLAYARSRPELLGTYIVDINAMFFGMPMALYPAIAKDFGGPEALGLMFAAPSAGSLVVTALSGWTQHVHRHGAAVVLAASGWGLAIIGFGFSDVLWLALVFLAIAGGMDAISGLFRATIWNETIPDRMRGRLAGIEMVSYMSGPALGNTEAGLVASAFGVRASVVSGGVLCVAGAGACAAALPALWRYDARETPPRPDAPA
jgi:MFS family permease